jgi:hypothetical protein
VGLAWLSAGSGLALCELPVEAFVHDANCFSTHAESGHSEPISNPPVPKDLDGAFALFAPDQLVPEKPGPCPSGETRNVKHLKVERQRPNPIAYIWRVPSDGPGVKSLQGSQWKRADNAKDIHDDGDGCRADIEHHGRGIRRC